MATNNFPSHEAFDLSSGPPVSPASGWTFLPGAFTDSGAVDLVGYHPSDSEDPARGSLWVGRNSGAGFDFTRWATVMPADGWVFLTGRFTGADRLDLVGYHPGNGSLWVGANTGSGFVFTQWATVAPASGWTFLAGGFGGGRRDDLVGYHPDNGSLWVGINEGASFEFAKWATVGPPDGWTFLSGHFTGGDRPDLVGYHPSFRGDPTTASLWVGRNTGRSFEFSHWASLTPAVGWTFHTGQFTNRIRTDLAAYHPSDPGNPGTHAVWVGANTGARFEFSRWSQFGASDWTFLPGQFAGNARSDLVGYDSINRQLWVWTNTGSSFFFEKWADLPAGQAFSGALLAGRFAGFREHDVVGYDRATGAIVLGRNRQPFKGYAWPQSGAPGDTIEFMLSGRGSDQVTFLRHEVDANVGSTTLVDETRGTATFTPVVQPVPPQVWRHGADWSPSFALTVPADWPSGIYSARFTDTTGTNLYVPFIVKPAPDRRSRVALLANVNTWLAYNDWGGSGKYGGAAYVSFLRPNPNTSPGATGFSPEHLTRGELLIATWLAREGFAPDVYTDVDFHKGAVGDGYHTLIFGTHPEYWTERMADHLRAFLDAGGQCSISAATACSRRAAITPTAPG